MICTCRSIHYYCRMWAFQQVYWDIWRSSCWLFITSRISMGNMCEKALSIIRIINWYWYATKRNGICHATHRYVKANNKYTTGYDKNQRIIVSNLVRWKQVIQMDTGSEITFRQFWMTKKYIKLTVIIVIKDTYLKLMLNILNNNMIHSKIYHFYLKECKTCM